MNIKSLLVVAVLATAILCSGGVVNAVDNSALIAQLQAMIVQLTAQLQTLIAQQGTPPVTWCHTFNTNLGFANSGNNEVIELHKALQKENICSSSDDISCGSDQGNMYYEDTAAAVVQFQTKYNLLPATGYTGVRTRAKLNSLYGCGITPPTCTPNWTCNWGSCTNGYQSQVITDANNCGISSSNSNIYCPTSTRTCGNLNVINGSCGSANGTSTNSMPTYNLCSTGTNYSVTGTGPWYWTCSGSNGGTTASCTASKYNNTTNGACETANGVGVTAKPTTGLCSTGTASFVTGYGPWYWTCSGSNGGTTASCTATLALAPVNGACGTANGIFPVGSTSFGTRSICATGNATPFFPTPENPITTWTCAGLNGGTSSPTCTATLMVGGSCGTANGVGVTVKPTTNLCSIGTASIVLPATGAGPWKWICTNGSKASQCGAPLLVNGVCGTANGRNFNPLDSRDDIGIYQNEVGTYRDDPLFGIYTGCTAGIFTPADFAPTVENPITTWTCAGLNGGTTSTCTANLIVDGMCNSVVGKGYLFGSTSWVYGEFCRSGVASPSAPSFPTPENPITTWTCAGLNGGTTSTCTASIPTEDACGTANNASFEVKPITNLCKTDYTASIVTGLGPWKWYCGAVSSCMAFSRLTSIITALSPNFGFAGSEVTITSNGFLRTAFAVWEGGVHNYVPKNLSVPGHHTSNDDKNMIIKVPNDMPLGTYRVSVISKIGQQPGNSLPFTVTGPIGASDPSVISVMPSTINQTDSITITGLRFSPTDNFVNISYLDGTLLKEFGPLSSTDGGTKIAFTPRLLTTTDMAAGDYKLSIINSSDVVSNSVNLHINSATTASTISQNSLASIADAITKLAVQVQAMMNNR